MYQKVGMFGMPHSSAEIAGDDGFKGDQIRGYGYLHDGSSDTLCRFFNAVVFNGGDVNVEARPEGGLQVRVEMDSHD